MKIPVPDKPEPDSYLKFPVPVMQNGMKIRKIRYPVPVSKSTFRSYPRAGRRVNLGSKGFSKGFFNIEIQTKGFSKGFCSYK